MSSQYKQDEWIDGKVREDAEYIITENGILNITRLLDDDFDPTQMDLILQPHTPDFFSTSSLPYPLDPSAKCPKWMAFLERNFEGDPERISLMQEWFGYCLTSDTSKQKFLMLEGEGSNGKSVICAALTATVGQENVSNVPLELFPQRFALTQTLGKRANIASEVGELDKVGEGFLKSFTAGDRMNFERKYASSIEAYPTARLTLATNNRPRFSDRSDGLWRRMLLLPLNVKIQDHEKVYGMDQPKWWMEQGELPGIFNWAIAGLAELRRYGRFTIPESTKIAIEDYKSESNSARSFLLEQYCEDADRHEETKDVYSHYRCWCSENGHPPMAQRTFGREVFRVFTNASKRRLGGSARFFTYQGIRRGQTDETEEFDVTDFN